MVAIVKNQPFLGVKLWQSIVISLTKVLSKVLGKINIFYAPKRQLNWTIKYLTYMR